MNKQEDCEHVNFENKKCEHDFKGEKFEIMMDVCKDCGAHKWTSKLWDQRIKWLESLHSRKPELFTIKFKIPKTLIELATDKNLKHCFSEEGLVFSEEKMELELIEIEKVFDLDTYSFIHAFKDLFELSESEFASDVATAGLLKLSR